LSEEEKQQASANTAEDSQESREKAPEQPRRQEAGAERPGKQPKKERKQRPAGEEESGKKREVHDENFNYIVRIANTDINGERSVIQGLTSIKGVGRHMATFISDTAGVDRTLKFGKLSEQQIQQLQTALANIPTTAPAWMMNRRKDLYTGENQHLISMEIATRLRDDVNLMKMIRSYKGVRHEAGLPVRGQRTRANGRFGLSLGVSKRREAKPSGGAKKEE
jgi:small subunit ribosomal protein S13